MLAVQAAAQRERADNPRSEPVSVWRGRGEMTACRESVAAVETDYGGEGGLAAARVLFFKLIGQDPHLGERLGPAPGLEEQLAHDAVRLPDPECRADLARE